jgi:hypothetical protein
MIDATIDASPTSGSRLARDERGSLVKHLVLAFCFAVLPALAGCELLVPPDQYRGETNSGAAGADPGAAEEAGTLGGDAEFPPTDGSLSTDAFGSSYGSPPADGSALVDRESGLSDGQRTGESGARAADASASASAKDAAVDVKSDATFPDGATAECHLACDGTYCCLTQVCCPSACGTRRCVLAPTCPSSANVACE